MRVFAGALAALLFFGVQSVFAYVVKGTVYDSSSTTPLSGVVVQVQGTTVQTTTDAQGKFSVTIEPPPAQSPSGTTIPSASQIVDATGTIWTLVNDQIARNSVIDASTGSVILLLYFAGVVYQETSHMQNGQNLWWKWTDGGWVSDTDPRAASVRTKQAVDVRAELSVVPGAAHQPIVIQYAMPHRGAVSLAVYDFTGKLVQRLVNGVIETGLYEVKWQGGNAGARSGCFLVRLKAGSFQRTAKIVVAP